MSKFYYGSVTVCLNCEYRRVGCHADCEIYKEAKDRSDRERKRIAGVRKKEYEYRQKARKDLWYLNCGV